MAKDRAGRYRHRITLQRDIGTVKREFGSRIEDWSDVATVWAMIEPIIGREQWNAIQTQSNLTHRLEFRYQNAMALTGAMRATLGSRVFAFAEPPRNVDERNRIYQVMAVEIVSEPGV